MLGSELRIELPENVRFIINTLTEHGFEAYAVGGCVRDSILHKEPGDWDITTSARPQQVKELFRRTIDTGIQHGTVTIMLGKEGYEVTTYRIDGEYEDGRHPKAVEFSTNLLEDLKRRDFTINAMAYNDECGLVDEFDGIGDINRRIIKCVGMAKERFMEDALRMMRAVRFSAQLGFEIERYTFDAVMELAPNIEKVSRERIQVEFTKTLLSDNPDYVIKFSDGGILSHILPRINMVLLSDSKNKVLAMLRYSEKNLSARYASLLFPAGNDEMETELRGLKLDNNTIELALKLASCMNTGIPEDETEMRHFMCNYGISFWTIFSHFMESYYKAFFSQKEELISRLRHADAMYDIISGRGDCVCLKQLAVNGRDLIDCGVKSGSHMGDLLKELLNDVLEEPCHNNREWLLAKVNKRNKN